MKKKKAMPSPTLDPHIEVSMRKLAGRLWFPMKKASFDISMKQKTFKTSFLKTNINL